MVKFNVSILNKLKAMGFFVNTEYAHKYNVIFNKTMTKLVSILTKCFFPYLNPTIYLKAGSNKKKFAPGMRIFKQLHISMSHNNQSKASRQINVQS